MKNPKVSIIIPVYGVEKYIAKCITSILDQSMNDFEAIIINDGSLDKSIGIAKKLTAGDSRFVFLSQENAGQGSARNKGLDTAKGNYIVFVDSDDYIEPDFLKVMYEAVTNADAEIGICDVKLVNESCEEIGKHTNHPDKYIRYNDSLNGYQYISNWLCDKIFKRSAFESMRFNASVRTFEDAHFTFRVIYNKKIIKIDKYLYNYLQRNGSTSNSLQPSFIEDRIAVKNTQLKFAEEIKLTDRNYVNFVYLRTFVFLVANRIARYSDNYNLDIQKLISAIDTDIFNFKNILFLITKYPKVGLPLLILKLSPAAFRASVKALRLLREYL